MKKNRFIVWIKKTKKYRDIFWIKIASLTIGFILYFIFDRKIEVLGAAIATGISFSLGVKQYKSEDDRIFKELFIEFGVISMIEFNE